ncbi:hypothetical protein BDV41DRAFT_570026 [Aspergillus transmontanensis]|uniref:Uncharacterized protein n=1 Tax=Aspergillus transmontanensis TaxID=1034304 RepID=A0A5N6VD91_9EURO|nr:hypothetical protein BDV41DRAFT_570026 [Aspergillus transmontanensis]
MAATAQDTLRKCGRGMFGVHGILTDAWCQGFMVGSVVILLSLTIMNMRRKTILHKLILAELVLASLHGTFVFVEGGAFGWYMSSTAAALYISYNLHNIINWMKVKPFLSRWGSRIYIGTVVLAIPFWIAVIYLNFAYNNHLGNDAFRQIRPWEALFREPWWIFTSFYLIFSIKQSYGFGVLELVRASAKLGVLLTAMTISIVFIIVDIVEVAVFPECAGRNPYWKLALTFKFMADAVFLDDFKTVLDHLTARATRDLICPLPDGPNIAGQSVSRNRIWLDRVPSNDHQRCDVEENSVMHIEDQLEYGSLNPPQSAHLN